MALITIESATIPGWQGNTSGISLRIYTNTDFTAATGTLYPSTVRSNLASLGTFFQSFACTVTSGSLVIPAITLDSTTDSPDNPQATYSAVIWDANVPGAVQNFGTLQAFAVPPTPTSTTWAALFAPIS